MSWAFWGCRGTRRTLRRAFSHRYLAAGRAQRTWRHVQHCADCRLFYNRAMTLERLAVSANQDGHCPAALELTLWSERVLPRSDREPEPSHGLAKRHRRWLLVGLVPAVAMSALVLLYRPAADDLLVPRSSGHVVFTVRALCEESSGGKTRVRSIAQQPSPHEVADCPSSATVRFAYRAQASGFVYVWLSNEDGDLVRKPGPDAGGSWHLAAASDHAPMSLSLPPGWGAGRATRDVVFVYSPTPLATDQQQPTLDDSQNTVVLRHHRLRVAPLN